jgi:hypothetical protein
MKQFVKTFSAMLLALIVVVALCGFALTRYRSLAITNSTIDSTPIGATTPSSIIGTSINSTTTTIVGTSLGVIGGVINSGAGLKHVRVGSCTANTATGGFCATTVTWPSAWADTNYTAVCSVDNTAVLFSAGTSAKTTTTISIIVAVTSGNTGSFSGIINCIGMHD